MKWTIESINFNSQRKNPHNLGAKIMEQFTNAMTKRLLKDEYFQCDYCNKRLIPGDKAIFVDSGDTYCSIKCMETDIQNTLGKEDPENCRCRYRYHGGSDRSSGCPF